MADSDSDAIPELVSSDSEGETPELPEKSNYQLAEKWLSKASRFLEMKDQDIRLFCFGPILFIINDLLPSLWINGLRKFGLVKNDKQGKEMSGYDWEEWALLDLIDAAFDVLQDHLRQKEHLVKFLDLFDKMEIEGKLDFDLGMRQVKDLPELQTKFFGKAICNGKTKEAQFAVLYIARMYRKHILAFGKQSKDLADETKRSLKSSFDRMTAEKNRDLGNVEFRKGQYDKAVEYYSRAVMSDPLSHIYFGNRAQTFNKLQRYRDGLADGRRCMLLKPDWPKGHYRYAQAFHALDKLDLAIEANTKGQELCKKCKDTRNYSDLEQQGNQFQQEKRNFAAKSLSKIPEELHRRMMESNFFSDHQSNSDSIEIVSGKTRKDKKIEMTIIKKTIHQTTVHKKEEKRTEPKIPPVKETPPVKKVEPLPDKKVEPPPVKKPTNNNVRVPSPKVVKPIPPKVQPVPPSETSSRKEEVLQHMAEGSNSMFNGLGKNALYSYQKALDIVAHNKYEVVGLDEEDHVVLKYACGMAGISTAVYKCILDSLEKFNDIISSHATIKFPLAYYGIGKAYIELNRYQEAREPIRKGILIVTNLNLTQLVWPGTKIKIKESTNKLLKEDLKSMSFLTKYPPSCDALCRFHSDDEDRRKEIYFTDPDFKGFVRIVCYASCVIEFHNTCWKVYKSAHGSKTNEGKTPDKDILDTACPTPDCTAVVIKIIIFRQDSLKKELNSEKPPKTVIKTKKPRIKMKLSSAHKITRREERKQIRKQKRRERKEEQDDLIDAVDQMMEDVKEECVSAEGPLSKTASANIPNVFVLKKDEDDPAEKYKGIRQKQPKTKRKKEKVKQLLNLEVNFTDEKEKFLLSENSLDEIPEIRAPMGYVDDENPFHVPQALQDSVSQFESSYQAQPNFTARDEITENMFSFFEDLLNANGPLHIEDLKITRELEYFPDEAKSTIDNAGGLGQFLRQSLKFAMVGNVVCLLKDAIKAKEISEEYSDVVVGHLSNSGSNKQPSLNPDASVFHPVQNSWQIVNRGKHSSKTVKEEDGSSLQKIQNGNVPWTDDRQISINNNFSQDNNSVEEYPEIDTHNNPPMSTPGGGNGGFYEESIPLGRFSPSSDSKMDTLDSIDDIPLVAVSKRRTGSNHLTNYPTSETDSESVKESSIHSDLESLCSQDDSKNVNRKKSSFDSAVEESMVSRSSSRSDVSDQSDLSNIWPNRVKPMPLSTGFVSEVWMSQSKGESGFSERNSPSLFNTDISEGLKMNGTPSNLTDVSTSHSFFSGKQQPSSLSLFPSSASSSYQPQLLNSQAQFSSIEDMGKDKYGDIQQSWTDYKTSFDINNLGKYDGLDDLRTPSSIWSNSRGSSSAFPQNKNKSAEEFMKQHYKSENPTSNIYSSVPSWSTNDDSSGDKNIHYSPSSNFNSTPHPPPLNLMTFSQKPPLSSLKPEFSLPQVRSSPSQSTNNSCINTPIKSLGKVDISVQCSVEVATVGINTDPYEPLKEDYSRLKKECDVLILNLETATARAHEMTEKSKTLDVQNKNLVEDCSRLSAEVARWSEDKATLFGEIQQMRQRLAHKEGREIEFQSTLEKILDEKRQILDGAEEYRKKYEVERDRAKKSEIEILKKILQQGRQNLERFQKDAEQHRHNLSSFARKHQDNQGKVPAQVQQALDYYTMVSRKCEEDTRAFTREIEVKIQQVHNGERLSELPSIQIPSIPPPPENMKALISMPFMFGPNSKAIHASRTVTPPPAITPPPVTRPNNGAGDCSSKPVQSNSTDSIQGPPKPRPPPMIGMMPRSMLARPPVISSLAVKPPVKSAFPRPVLTHAPASSFEKLISTLLTMFPNYDRNYFTSLIRNLRQSCGGSMSGMKLEDIIEKIKQLIAQQEQVQQQQQNLTNQGNNASRKRPLAPPPGLSSSWGFPKPVAANSSVEYEVFQEEEDPCVICHDEMVNQETSMLACGHKFHSECIRKWLKEQSTCPNCRIHALLPDEFPALK